ncbi:hypothetical protein Patl1_07131 [Pistacia atlantica]|uniref:Uncharacterized protein n=1 Tax=Pistacia atlantica TaxID=434234 RepID=A0ACC1AIX9_9ROSI|nr:hypothetical protein Patl1_07131 [Pistacia atlantica]
MVSEQVLEAKISSIKFDIEKFNRRINFGLWQVQVKDVMIQSGLHKVLKGRPTPDTSKEGSRSGMSDEDWEEFDLKAASVICLSLAKNVYLKEQFHTLCINEGTTIFDHLSVLNGIISKLEAIGMKIDDKDIA